MTAVVVVGTLAVVLYAAVAVWRAHKRIETAMRGGWCDCQACERERARLVALFNDKGVGE